ncbi:hypothetical protein FKM82_009565 [Ascaphus truei]
MSLPFLFPICRPFPVCEEENFEDCLDNNIIIMNYESSRHIHKISQDVSSTAINPQDGAEGGSAKREGKEPFRDSDESYLQGDNQGCTQVCLLL